MRSAFPVTLAAILCSCADDGGVTPSGDTESTGAPETDAGPTTASTASTTAPTTDATTSDATSSSSGSSGETTMATTGTTSTDSSGTAAESSSSTAAESSSSTTGEQAACIDLGNAVPQSVEGDTENAGDEVPVEGLTCTILPWDGDDVAYTWTAPAAGWYRFTAIPEGLDGPALSLLDGCGGETLQCELENTEDYGAWAAIELAADQTIAIVVDARTQYGVGPFELTVEELPECSAAIDLGSELVTALPGNAEGAGDEAWIGCGFDAAESHDDVTYAWTAPQTGLYAVTISGAGLSGGVGVFRGVCNNPGDQVACRSISGMDESTTSNFPAQAGEALAIVVDTFINSDTSIYQLDIAYVGPLEGDCCAQNAAPGCSDFSVTACVCEVVPECCSPEFGWLEFCAGVAGDVCGACEPVDAGDCCDPHDTLSCSEPFVAACACQGHYACCDDEFWGEPWDEWCIQIADAYCNVECA